MQEKEQIELHLSKLYLEWRFKIQIDNCEIIAGDPLKSQPDIFYKDLGIEIGAVLKGNNTHLDNYEKEFLNNANNLISGKIPSDIRICLIMQDDKDTVQHTPNKEFAKYRFIPEYLDGIFADKFLNNQIINKQIVLNQKPLIRVDTFPSITNQKKFNGFINELVDYVLNLTNDDFINSPLNFDNRMIHHRVVCSGIVINSSKNPLDGFISKKIIDKLKKDKYKGNHKQQILLLHNYSILANKEFTTDIHFYSHYRDYVFNKIAELINLYKSFEIYDEIIFMDFSKYAANKNFEIFEFKTYEIKMLNYDVIDDGHIRCNIMI